MGFRMLFTLLLAFAASCHGLRQCDECQSRSTSDYDLSWISKNSTLPKVVAGGTILSTSEYSRLDNVAYGTGPVPKASEVIANVSEILDVAQVAIVDVPTNWGSASYNSSLFLNLTHMANRHLCTEDSSIVGAVMFHGTDTLEETAFGVDATLNCSKPFVATGAMRPVSYISSDGLSNVYQAVSAAASPSSRNRGGLIAFNDRITSIYYSSKTHANNMDTFKSPEQGNLGAFLAGQPYYYFGPALPTGRPHFNVTDTEILPSVVTLYGHQGFDDHLMDAAVANGAKGLVMMGPGAAWLSNGAYERADSIVAMGIPIVTVPRPGSGTGVPEPEAGSVIYSSFMQAPQARITLQLAINANYSMDRIRELFENPLREAIYGPTVNQNVYYP